MVRADPSHPTAAAGGAAWPPARLPFAKMSGSGNDFVMVDNRTAIIPPDQEVAFTRAICDRRRSVGADGVVFIEHAGGLAGGLIDATRTNFAWRYRNADGSNGEFCGNGAMCAARYAFLHGISGNQATFVTPAGIVVATMSGDADDPRVAIDVADPSAVSGPVSIEAAGHTVVCHTVTVGVPHAVTFVDDIDRPFPAEGGRGDDFVAVGRAARYDATFAPHGTNLNAVEVIDRHTVAMRTYERGVEDETLACGSGSIASSIIATMTGRAEPPITVITRGGNRLVVTFDQDPRSARAMSVRLTGQARLVAEGDLLPDAWQHPG